MQNWPSDLVPVRGAMAVAHLLVEREGLVLLDTGLPGDAKRLRRAVERLGAGPKDVRAIILTHGHLDHAGSLAVLKAWTGAPVYAHPLEQVHIDGKFPYRKTARICGALEMIGRGLSHYQPASIDVPLADGDVLPFWGGLRVVHLPGHTLGHCGFYSSRHDLLFTGDLWVRFMMLVQMSPPLFSDDVSLVPASMRKARAIGARWIVPNHYDRPDAVRLRRRFEELCEEMERKKNAVVI
jgi:glyoxylase-like metal-dependent hydrolase (beta-lactamase superfamily II)